MLGRVLGQQAGQDIQRVEQQMTDGAVAQSGGSGGGLLFMAQVV